MTLPIPERRRWGGENQKQRTEDSQKISTRGQLKHKREGEREKSREGEKRSVLWHSCPVKLTMTAGIHTKWHCHSQRKWMCVDTILFLLHRAWNGIRLETRSTFCVKLPNKFPFFQANHTSCGSVHFMLGFCNNGYIIPISPGDFWCIFSCQRPNVCGLWTTTSQNTRGFWSTKGWWFMNSERTLILQGTFG